MSLLVHPVPGRRRRVRSLARWSWLACCGLALTACSDGSSSTSRFPALCSPSATVFFDSSFSDTGNIFEMLGGLAPRNPPYFEGRFSNGPVAAEYLAAALGTSALASSRGGTNYAVGGARTSQTNFLIVPSIAEQVRTYLRLVSGMADPDALYVLRVGANDVPAAIEGASTDIDSSIVALDAMLVELQAAGARHFLVYNLPDLPTYGAGGTEVVVRFDAQLRELTARKRDDEGIDIRVVDVLTLVDRMRATPDSFGLENVTDPCLGGGPCNRFLIDPVADGFLLYDELHLTTRVHEIIARDAALDPRCAASRPR